MRIGGGKENTKRATMMMVGLGRELGIISPIAGGIKPELSLFLSRHFCFSILHHGCKFSRTIHG